MADHRHPCIVTFSCVLFYAVCDVLWMMLAYTAARARADIAL
jgi:hypothetical protein